MAKLFKTAYLSAALAVALAALMAQAFYAGRQSAENSRLKTQLQELTHATQDAQYIRDLAANSDFDFDRLLCEQSALRDGDCGLHNHGPGNAGDRID